MVQTRKQANAEAAQVAGPVAPVPSATDPAPAPQVPASTTPKTKKTGDVKTKSAKKVSSGKGTKEKATAGSSKKATPKKATPKKATPNKSTPEKKATPAKVARFQASPEDPPPRALPLTETPTGPNDPPPSKSDTLQDDRTTVTPLKTKPQRSSTKKARAKQTPKKTLKAPENEVANQDVASEDPAKVKDKASPKTGTKRKSRAAENNIGEKKNEDIPEEPPKKKSKPSANTEGKKSSPKVLPSKSTDTAPSAAGKKKGRAPTRRSPHQKSIDSDETEEISDLPQLYSDYNARVRAAAEELDKVAKARISELLDYLGNEYDERIGKQGAKPSKKRGASAVIREAGDQEPPRKRTKRSSRTNAAATEEDTQEPPKKKTKRSSRTNATTERDNAGIGSQNDVPVASTAKKASSAGAPKKLARTRNPRPAPTSGLRKSARFSGVQLDRIISIEDRFKRAKSSPIPINDIGLDEYGKFTPFNPRPPKPAMKSKASVSKTRDVQSYGDRAREKAEINRRKPLTVLERAIIRRITERLVSGDEVRSAEERLPVRFQPNLLGSARYGVVELGAHDLLAQRPALTNRIHPIWAARNFDFSQGAGEGRRGYNGRAYRAIAPALRLVTHWIGGEEFGEFWNVLCGGDITQDEVVTISASGPSGVDGNTLSEESNTASSKASTEASIEDRIADLMHDLAELESLEWRFAPTETRSVGLSMTAGQVSTFHDSFERDLLYHLNPPRDSLVTTSGRLRMLFLLAVHLCRQLVQQVYHHRWSRAFGDTPPPSLSEVLFESVDGTSDYLEVAWDTFMFTGLVVNMNPHRNREAESPNGLAIALGSRAAEWNGSPSPMSFAALRMHWIDDLFQNTFWAQTNGAGNFPRLPDENSPYCAQGPFT